MRSTRLGWGPFVAALAVLIGLALFLWLPEPWDLYVGGGVLVAIMLVFAVARAPRGTTGPISDIRRQLTLGVIGTLAMLVAVDVAATVVALPTAARDLPDAAFEDMARMVAAYLLGIAALAPFAAILGNKLGHRRTLTCGLLLFVVASLAATATSSLALLTVARLVQGAGVGLAAPAALATLRSKFHGEHRRSAFATCGRLSLAGLIVGVLLGVLLPHAGWQIHFTWNVLVCVIAMAVAHWLIPASRAVSRGVDLIGIGMAPLGIGLVVCAIIALQFAGWSSGEVVVPGAAGLVLLGILGARRVWPTRRDGESVRPASYGRPVTVGTIAAAILCFIVFGGVFAITFHFQEVHRYSPLEAGLAFVPLILGMTAAGIGADQLTRRFGLSAAACFGVFLGAAAVIGVELAIDGPDHWLVTGLALVLVGLAAGAGMLVAWRAIATAPWRPVAGADATLSTALCGGALGVAVTSTHVGTSYRDHVVSWATQLGFPNHVAELAGESVSRGSVVADGLPSRLEHALRLLTEKAYADSLADTLSLVGWLVLAAGLVLTWFASEPAG